MIYTSFLHLLTKSEFKKKKKKMNLNNMARQEGNLFQTVRERLGFFEATFGKQIPQIKP